AGITNLLVRVMVRGTPRRNALQIAQRVEDLGGMLEASGEVETAEIRGAVLAPHWEALLAEIADVALRPTLPPHEIATERALVLSQIQTRADTPFPRAMDAVMAELYGPHPYARHRLGRAESVRALSREALLAHHAALYRPERLVLAVSGHVASRRVVAAARRLFGTPGAPGPPPAPEIAAPAPRTEPRTVEAAAAQAQVLVAYLGPSSTDADYAAMRVLSAVLGGGMSGRLFRELRDRRGLAYSVGTLSSYRTGPGYLLAYLGTAPATAGTAVSAVLDELARVRVEPATAQEVERARAYLLGNVAMDRRTNARHAWYLAFFEVVGAGWDWADRYVRALQAVTVDDVARVAGHYLGTPSVVVLRPGASS
ncbi:MAG TPA: pitrilysin family protein, partial [Candidatus Limnocylindria bacterium]|nr:pitrilysin family protein [Candidatus Limnocylindria bacterium]